MNKKTGLTSFHLDVDIFQDEKVQFVSARFGWKGEAVLIRLLCKIYRQGYYVDWNDDIALLFAKGVGDGCSDACVKDVVFELLKRGFFDRSIFERFSILTSHRIQEQYFTACVRRKKVSYIPDYILIDISEYDNLCLPSQNASTPNQNVDILDENANTLSKNDDIFKQSKVKESKVKESKGENTPPQEAHFETAKKIIAHLNAITGRHYDPANNSYFWHIQKRLQEGYNYEQFVHVVDVKATDWLDDPKMTSNLNPKTLFGDKFDIYVNQPAKPKNKDKDGDYDAGYAEFLEQLAKEKGL